jgi:hypothetical protein
LILDANRDSAGGMLQIEKQRQQMIRNKHIFESKAALMVTRSNGMNPVVAFNGATSFTTGLFETKHKQSHSALE